MKTTAKILTMILGSFVAVLVWWAYFPIPPFPESLMMALAPVTKLVASNQLPDLMEVWALLGILSYVAFAVFVAYLGIKIRARNASVNGPNHQFQRTPNGTPEQ